MSKTREKLHHFTIKCLLIPSLGNQQLNAKNSILPDFISFGPFISEVTIITPIRKEDSPKEQPDDDLLLT